jgi:16S rRNA (guanine966-N2)-methyltransferase
MSVRVIAGTAKGHKLRVPRGITVRPTPDRAKGGLFNALGDRVVGSKFLDLYAGSGAIGIEALSRGAAAVEFVEMRADVAVIIERNLSKTGLAEHGSVVIAPAEEALRRLANESRRFDIIFADPPYKSQQALEILQVLGRKELLNEEGLVVWEHESGTGLPAQVGKLSCFKELRYGDTSFAFLS